jgi:rhamnosyltransferase
VSAESQAELAAHCHRFIQRENTGMDFLMWQAGLAVYDLAKYDELLLTNSSIIGPLKPLAALWQSPAIAGCDFWGLTDNGEMAPHLQSYFLVFRSRVLHSEIFAQFWRAVLPFRDKYQLIRSCEIGLTVWLEQNGFQWRALYSQRVIVGQYLSDRNNRGFITKCSDRLKNLCRKSPMSIGYDTTVFFPDYLIKSDMPFLKLSLLKYKNIRIDPECAFNLLIPSLLSEAALDELRAFLPSQCELS